MSTLLQAAAIDFIRGQFTAAQVAEVRPYAGEFNAEEVAQLSFRCPAVLVALLGWRPGKSERLVGRSVRVNRLVAFVVTKHAQRDLRMQQAAAIAEQLGAALDAWSPADTEALAIGPLEEPPTVENLYGRAIDKAGLALWQADWRQAARTLVPPSQLYDLLAIEITDHTAQGTVPDAPVPPADPMTVTEGVQFDPLPPT